MQTTQTAVWETTQTAVWETSQTAVSKLPFEWVYHSAVAVPNTPLLTTKL